MRGFGFGLAALIALVVMSGAPASAASWSRPFSLTTPGEEISGPVVAASPSGHAVIAWSESEPAVVKARKVARDGTIGPVLRISDRGGNSASVADVAVSTNGDAIVVWAGQSPGGSSLYARRIGAGGALGRMRMLHGPRSKYETDVDVAIDGRGTATVVWSEVYLKPQSRGWDVIRADLYVRRLGADGRLGPTIEIPPGDAHDYSPRVAVSPVGRATIAWRAENVDGSFVRSVTLSADRRRRPADAVSEVRQLGLGADPEIVAGERGRAVVAWRVRAGDTGLDVVARAVGAGGRLGALRSVAQGAGALYDIKTDATGRVLLIVSRSGKPDEVSGRRMRIPGLTAPIWKLAHQAHIWPNAAIEANGRALTVAWTRARYDSRGDVISLRALSQRVTASGRAGRVSVVDRSPGPGSPQLVANTRGRLLAVWRAGELYAARRH